MKVFAYLDPGTGSMIIQAIIGGLVGIGVILKTFWGRIVGIFKKTDLDNSESKSLPKTAKTSK